MTNDILAKRIADLERQLSTAKSERDALAAQLSLAKNIFDVLFSLPDADTREEISSEVDTWLQLKAVFDATPQQCLRDVQAKAGRAGYLKGADDWKAFQQVFDSDINDSADEYAESIRQGGDV